MGRWVAAVLAPVDRLVRRITETTAEEALVALESWRPVRAATETSAEACAETSADPAADHSPASTPSPTSVLGE